MRNEIASLLQRPKRYVKHSPVSLIITAQELWWILTWIQKNLRGKNEQNGDGKKNKKKILWIEDYLYPKSQCVHYFLMIYPCAWSYIYIHIHIRIKYNHQEVNSIFLSTLKLLTSRDRKLTSASMSNKWICTRVSLNNESMKKII